MAVGTYGYIQNNFFKTMKYEDNEGEIYYI